MSRPLLPPEDVREEALEILCQEVKGAMGEMLERLRDLERKEDHSAHPATRAA